MDKIIQEYKNPKTGLTSLTRFAKNIKYKDIPKLRSILESSEIFTKSIHARQFVKHTKRKFIASHVGEVIHADLMDISNFKLRNKFILVMVDVFSRYTWAIPVQSKSGEHVNEAVDKVYTELIHNGYIPDKMCLFYVDDGREFYGIPKKLKTPMYNTYLTRYISKSRNGASIAEAKIKVLRQHISLYLDTKPASRDFTKVLDDICSNINRNTGSDTCSAEAIYSKTNCQFKIRKRKKAKQIQRTLYFHLNDWVRLENSFEREVVFSKKSNLNYFSDNIYKIVNIKVMQSLPMYGLAIVRSKETGIINRWVYEWELSRVSDEYVNQIKGDLAKFRSAKEKNWYMFKPMQLDE